MSASSHDHTNHANHADHDPGELVGGDLHEHVALRLALSDQRYTTGRRRLIEILENAEHPVTLPTIASDHPDIVASSAYRNLDVLESAGVIRRIASGGDHAHFELAEPLLDHHHHLICVDCGTIVDVQLDDELERIVHDRLSQAARDAGFTPLHHSLDGHGRCPACQKAS